MALSRWEFAIVLCVANACASLVMAQGPEPDAGLVALHQARLDAVTSGVVLNIAAHPDDEASRTNTILRRKHALRVVTAYSTYGDGGQNAIGKEIGPELARLRVRETLAAAAMMDFEVRWLGMRDFGFSKSLDETLAVWGKDALLDAMRKVVDEVDPDFVVTNHDLVHGHGHHRASFWAISEVIEERRKAGKHAPALYSRCSLEEAQWTVDPGELDPVRGETYARLAHRAWTQHVTQGPWSGHEPLQVGKDYWKLALPLGAPKEVAAQPLSFVRPRFARAAESLATEIGGVMLDSPIASVEARAATALRKLREWAKPLDFYTGIHPQLEVKDESKRRIDALQRVLLSEAGVRVEAWLEESEVPRGGEGKAYVVVHGMERVQNLVVRCGDKDAEPVAPRIRSSFFDAMPAVLVGATPADLGVGNGATTANGAAPAVPAPPPIPVPGRLALSFLNAKPIARAPEVDMVTIDVAFDLIGVEAPMEPGIHYLTAPTQTVRIEMQRKLAFSTVEPVEVTWDREVVLAPNDRASERIFSASVRSKLAEGLAEPIRVVTGAGIRAEAIPSRVSLSKDHAEARVLVRASIDGAALSSDPAIRLEVGGQKASLRIVPVEVFVPPGLRIGLVRGPDDTIERTLADLGIAYSQLDRDALATARLDEFSALLLDMRSYHHVPELAEHKDRILQYCRAGGRVVAMYHKPGEWNERAGHPLLAPFALTVGNDRCTEEDSAVVMLQPQHAIWTKPHAITMQDFEGWTQERGLNFPSKWDTAWTPLLETKDRADEKSSQGALLHTQYGRGDFVYCSLALYRQLRNGHAGSARILVNLLAR